MQKVEYYVIKIALILASFCSVGYGPHKVTNRELKAAQAKIGPKSSYPYALISDDFGILSAVELALSGCRGIPKPFKKDFDPYPYWQCFETDLVKFKCSTDEKINKPRTSSILSFVVASKPLRQEYLIRHVLEFNACVNYRNEWKKAIKNQKYVCFLGEFLSTVQRLGGEPYDDWTFVAYKSKILCTSYFEGRCDLGEALKYGCEF
jgi:hypothetical protein